MAPHSGNTNLIWTEHDMEQSSFFCTKWAVPYSYIHLKLFCNPNCKDHSLIFKLPKDAWQKAVSMLFMFKVYWECVLSSRGRLQNYRIKWLFGILEYVLPKQHSASVYRDCKKYGATSSLCILEHEVYFAVYQQIIRGKKPHLLVYIHVTRFEKDNFIHLRKRMQDCLEKQWLP